MYNIGTLLMEIQLPIPTRMELFVTTIIQIHRNIDDEANLSLL